MAQQHVYDLADIHDHMPTAVAIGVFDGVHRGHQALLADMVAAARAANLRPAVLTFFPHPKLVIQGRTEGRYYLSRLSERAQLLVDLGVDLVITQLFDEQVRMTRAREFIGRLQAAVHLRQLWGGNFSLGHRREGDYDYLSRLGQEQGFTVHLKQNLVMANGERVSSSRIRRGLASGDIDDVNACLGRAFRVSGEVVQGAQRGRTIGFPTANVAAWEQQLLPANGVYATIVRVGEQRYAAATNVGVRPTVAGNDVTVEAHCLDFDGDLYGKTIEVDFVSHIRGEKKFAGMDALKAGIAADVEQVRRLALLTK
ncbi:MAG: bifunctional riboflavin kinase/FAD synthetase [Anaerolineae bacterium]|nr:bifunctional riboflavin kinase/FAD synthetase [Anaerolineae bacterium]MCO5207737.1 bifunctional riboflavin kinase/FAD synthetase [Anaerolineae bacterium]